MVTFSLYIFNNQYFTLKIMKNFFTIIFLFSIFIGFSQEETYMKGQIFSMQNNLPLENVNILNLNQVKGAITNIKGDFTIQAAVNDTLHISYIGYKSVKLRVTSDMIKYSGTKIGMSEIAYSLDEVIVTPYRLTGIVKIDAKYIPVNTNKQYSISGLSKGYEVRNNNGETGTVGKVFGAIFRPIDFLHNTFGSRPREMRKLKKMKEEDAIRNTLLTKFDRETITEMLNITKDELEEMLRNCKYSKEFITNANDLQILDALSECYEEYKVLKK